LKQTALAGRFANPIRYKKNQLRILFPLLCPDNKRLKSKNKEVKSFPVLMGRKLLVELLILPGYFLTFA
jgi:hypothetical protein